MFRSIKVKGREQNVRTLGLLSVAEEIYVVALVDRSHRVIKGLTDEKIGWGRGGLRKGRVSVDQIFTLK